MTTSAPKPETTHTQFSNGSQIGTIPIVLDASVALCDKEGVEVLFWIIEGAMHVHPVRLRQCWELMTRGKIAHRISP